MNNIIIVPELSAIEISSLSLLEESGFAISTKVVHAGRSHVVGLFVRTHTEVNESFLKQYPNIKFILKAGVGLDNIDKELCQRNQIEIFNSPASNSSAVAEYIIMVILIHFRKLFSQNQILIHGGWRLYEDLGEELSGRTLGLVGFGSVGRELASKIGGFNFHILAYDPYVGREDMSKLGVQKIDLEGLLASSDIISIQLPLTESTRGMFTLAEFKKMTKIPLFINVSRGELVDEKSLIESLSLGYIRTAILDVFCNEPNINPRILNNSKIFATPHIAGFTKEAHKKMSLIAVNNMLNYYQDNHFWLK